MSFTKRSRAVTASGILAIVASVFSVLGALSGLLGVLWLSHLAVPAPTQPPSVLAVELVALFFFLGIGVYGTFAAVGLLRFKNWARISAMVWAGVTAPPCAFALVTLAFLPLPSPANAPVHIASLRIFVAAFYGIPLAVAVWWLILFNRKVIADQFRALPEGTALSPGLSAGLLPQPPGGVPIPIVVLACFFLVSAASMSMVFWVHFPAIVWGAAIRGPAGTAFYGAWCLLFAVAGVGLLRRIRWSYSLAIALHVFGLANGVVTILSPNFERFMTDAMASTKFPAGGAYPMPVIGSMRAISSVGVLAVAVILAILVYYRSRFVEACAATAAS